MSERPIGYYVHHHGAGHMSRARAIMSAGRGNIVLLGTGVSADGVDLADDRPRSGRFDGADEADCRPDALHYAPVDHQGIRSRVARIARWIEVEKPSLMVVDVSVEVAMLARLASVPTVYVRLNGNRNDPAHLDAFRGARGLLAPFHEDLEPAGTPRWVREKSRYLPGITGRPSPGDPVPNRILVVMGRGGAPGDGEAFAIAARTMPDWQWRIIGPCTAPRSHALNLDVAGWVHEPEREIGLASVVIGGAGDGLIGAVMAADRPFICIPQPRPYDEQQASADRLGELGAALVLNGWPEPSCWPALIEAVLRLPSDARQRLHDHDGARNAAEWITNLADRSARALERAA